MNLAEKDRRGGKRAAPRRHSFLPTVKTLAPRGAVASTVSGLLEFRVEASPEAIASYHRDAQKNWRSTTWRALDQEVRQAARALRGLGLDKKDRLAIFSHTCRQWQLAELAGLAAGAVVVGIDAHASPVQADSLLEHCGARALIVDTPSNLEKISQAIRGNLKFIVLLESGGARPSGRLFFWSEISGGRDGPIAPAAPSSEDPATLVYTSGTSGPPKGIEFSHGQLMEACREILHEFSALGEGNSTICWMPMANLFQRMINLVAIATGATTYFVEDPREVLACAREAEPTVFVGVPRFYEKLRDGIRDRVASLPPWRRRWIERAMQAGASRTRRQGPGSASPPVRGGRALLESLALRRIRRVLGRNIRFLVSGSAPVAPELLAFFESIGLLILEAYALTENAIPVSANRPESYRFGSVGRPFSSNQLRFAEDGEILIRGTGLFRGYEKEGRPEELFTSDGFYKTGDYGHLDADGFLYLTGRKSEILKTSTGRRVCPAQIEAVYRESPLVEEIVVVGNGRRHLAALVTLDVPCVQRMLAQAGEPLPLRAALARSPWVERVLREDFRERGRRLAPHEQIRAFAVLPESLSLAKGDLTTTLKLRRDRIEANYASWIDRLYAGGADAPEAPDGPMRSEEVRQLRAV